MTEPSAARPVVDLQPAASNRRSRRPFVVAAVLLVVVVLGGGILAFVLGRGSGGYTAEDQQRFMAACTAGSGDQYRGVCACIYDQLAAKVPYERFTAVDAELRDQTPPLRFPPDVDAIRAGCVERTG